MNDKPLLIECLEPGAAERGEDLEHLTRAGQHPPRRQYATTVEPVAAHPLLYQRGADGMIATLLVDLDSLIGVELGHSLLATEIGQRCGHLGKGLHSQQMERDAEGRQLAAQHIDLRQHKALTNRGHFVLPPLGGRDDKERGDRFITGAGMP